MKTRKYSRVGYKCCDGNYYEDTYGRRITPVEVRELPLEELNSYQKRLIGALCRRFAVEGAERVTEELDKLQYCSLETALRVAQNGGYLPQDKPQTLTATGEGLIEAADGMLLIEGQNVMEKIADKLLEDFIGVFYGRITVHFEVLPDRDPLIFEIGG